MNQRTKGLIHLIAKGILTVVVLFSVILYFTKYEDIALEFSNFPYPVYLIYPLAVAKILGLIALWFKVPLNLREWAYAGFFYNFLLAITAHLQIQDGEQFPAIIAMLLLLTTYFTRQLVLE